MDRYSKDLSAYLSLVGQQTSDASYREEAARMDALYVRGEPRGECSNCNSSLAHASEIRRKSSTSVEVIYRMCSVCRHISGSHRISKEFVSQVYGVNSGDVGLYDTDFYFDRDEAAFQRRVDQIYRPKAEFFAGALSEQGVDPHSIEVLDVGGGAGHMVSALRHTGFQATGIEVSQAAIRQAAAMNVGGMHLIPPERLGETLRLTSASAISMICLLPHMERVDDVMGPILENERIRYVFQLLPLASLSAVLSLAAGSLTARVLSGSHTHLSTLESLYHLEDRLGVERIGAWWFGTDTFSLLELLRAGMQESIAPGQPLGDWETLVEPLIPLLNKLQGTLDAARYCDQVHLVWQIRRT